MKELTITQSAKCIAKALGATKITLFPAKKGYPEHANVYLATGGYLEILVETDKFAQVRFYWKSYEAQDSVREIVAKFNQQVKVI